GGVGDTQHGRYPDSRVAGVRDKDGILREEVGQVFAEAFRTDGRLAGLTQRLVGAVSRVYQLAHTGAPGGGIRRGSESMIQGSEGGLGVTQNAECIGIASPQFRRVNINLDNPRTGPGDAPEI